MRHCWVQTFQLSPVELAGIIECCTTGKSMKELFHDPNKGREWVPWPHLFNLPARPRSVMRTGQYVSHNSGLA